MEVTMSRSASIAMACLVWSAVAHAAPATQTRTVVQRRAVFDLVSVKTDVRALCEGHEALDVELQRTPADVAAAVFSGMWYTPAHLRVTCAAP
jgi:hypothetical protein